MEAIGQTLDNVHWNFTSVKNNETLDNVKGGKTQKELYTEQIARRLVEKFNAPSSYNFFLKCAWRLSEGFIWSTYESANRPDIKSPIRYFVAVCHKQMN